MSDTKKQLFEQLAQITHSLASPQRLELLDYIAQSDRSVDELSQLSGLTVANTSRHLGVLKQSGLVQVRKQGKNRIYSMTGADVIQLVMALRKSAEIHNAEIVRLQSSLSASAVDQQTITSSELIEKLDQNSVLIVDVRPQKEFEQGHIKGAINVPPETIEQALEQLPKDKEIVAYCRGPYCQYSYNMVDNLMSNGRTAHRLLEGFPEWKASGLPYSTQIH